LIVTGAECATHQTQTARIISTYFAPQRPQTQRVLSFNLCGRSGEKTLNTNEKWFEHVWRQREEEIYPRFFGSVEPEIHTIKPELFNRMGVKSVDPRWLTHGVLASPPSTQRATWLYVTSGLSNPWGADPDAIDLNEYSGLGFEFFMQTTGPASWAIGVLNWIMAMQILIAAGLVEGQLLEPLDRIPMNLSLDGGSSQLKNLLIITPEDIPPRFVMESGIVDLLACVGITDAELHFARAQGGLGLLKVLKHHGYLPVTDPGRSSAV
jgi:Suppressor of fused protein (SUFU)